MAENRIKIYGRIRPLRKAFQNRVQNRKFSLSDSAIKFNVGRTEKGLINNQREYYDFQFNKLFSENVTQEEVFEVVAKPVIDNVLEGYNGTIFAYGQTGSGKTFTITGGSEKYSDRGLIPRTIQHIFKKLHDGTKNHFDIHISYLELYNEVAYDLLDASRDAKKLEDLKKVVILEDDQDKIHLKNLTEINVTSEEETFDYLFTGVPL